MRKIEIEICCGTACYLLGGSELMRIEEFIPEAWRGRIEVTAVPCMSNCESHALGRAPFVRVDGETFGNANVELVMERLAEIFSAEAAENE